MGGSTYMKSDILFNEKTVLITGGTGSFGNAFLDRLLKTSVKEIRIFSRDEKKQDDMRRKYMDDRIKFYLGDVREISSLKNAFHKVDYIFHAAALKQVPSCEFFPLEAVKTNIIGTDNVLTVAIENKVKKVVCLSTDKAAYPINAMGISKAMMEKVFVAKSKIVDKEDTIICGTRYGNVMASRGSVIPLFVSQIKNKQPLTITNPKMTRFLMSLEDAVELVMYAFENGSPGDIFVQKAPASTIETLAKAVKDTFNAPNELITIGARHGEKLYETLLTKEEFKEAIDYGDYYKIPADQRDLNYEKYFDVGDKKINSAEDYNSDNTEQLSVEAVKKALLHLDFIQTELTNWVNEK